MATVKGTGVKAHPGTVAGKPDNGNLRPPAPTQRLLDPALFSDP